MASRRARKEFVIMQEIQLVVFDFDGVLCDTAADIASAVQAAQKQYNTKIMNLPDIISHVGLGARHLIRKCLPELSDENLAQALEWYRNYYRNNSVVETKFYDGVLETLENIEKTGASMCILSNKPEAITINIIEHFGAERYFTKILGPESLGKMKPDPEGLFLCMEACGVSPSKTLMIGDTYTDIITGHKAGTNTCGVKYGLGNIDDLLNINADVYIERMPDLFNNFTFIGY